MLSVYTNKDLQSDEWLKYIYAGECGVVTSPVTGAWEITLCIMEVREKSCTFYSSCLYLPSSSWANPDHFCNHTQNNDSSYRCQIHLYGVLIQYTLSLFSYKSHLKITGNTSIWAGNLQGSLKLAGERLQIQQRPLLPRNLDCKPIFLLQCFGPSSCWTDLSRKCRSHNFLKSLSERSGLLKHRFFSMGC